ncbi:hypothetical protein Y1Q_0018532 [Alligator mississippiensis]|uniref:Uncharacterized protein n=1 Tax=Alligator mississippiensis TaxID=8496 RepID=A0A151NBG2_ALLMI|nr:hypothetical protein Y1Q_0018532 [Alligator mississippiensis]
MIGSAPPQQARLVPLCKEPALPPGPGAALSWARSLLLEPKPPSLYLREKASALVSSFPRRCSAEKSYSCQLNAHLVNQLLSVCVECSHLNGAHRKDSCCTSRGYNPGR